MKKVKSELPLSYVTIKTTKSRIDKGLLAIPVSLIDIFPKKSNKIYLVNERGIVEVKTFTPYNSSSRECRIGGLKTFYENYQVSDGEELVIQLIDNDKYRIIPEKLFQNILSNRLTLLKNSIDDDESDKILYQISEISNLQKIDILKNEFVALSKEKFEDRKKVEKNTPIVRESVPFSIRKILVELYEGKCQVTNFSFFTKKNKPYFELHHIDPEKGNHLKNLLVVSPNTHAQFTHANLIQHFDNEGWLRKVKFNKDEYKVFQIIDDLPNEFEKEIHF
ncbi:MAG TPA: HNH endonuclease signature motif containing protein [Paludibacteraceae bacterium]|jgi:hypothetical protein|nr:HNH endonuclease signature motif containing protein [Paludibacteraceae bacterium]